jgi:peptide chain release factor 2
MADLREKAEELEERLSDLEEFFDLQELRKESNVLSEEMSRPGFWDDSRRAKDTSARFSRLGERISMLEELRRRVEDSRELLELADDEDMLFEVEGELSRLERTIEEQEVARLFSGEYDDGPAILTINAGAGGQDSQDWAEMLARMYMRWAERKGHDLEVIEYTEVEEGGIKSATFTIDGPYAFGLLSAEKGVHRLVRISPFDSSGRRHTSFASVTVAPVIGEAEEVEIEEKDLRMDTYRASGAGGQHVNTTDSAVRLTHLPTGIVVQCQNERSQRQNREVAMRVLRARLFEIEQERREREVAAQRGEKSEIEWGSQIRSYVLHPYRMVKDHRSGHESSNVERVLEGDIEEFIYAYLKSRAAA